MDRNTKTKQERRHHRPERLMPPRTAVPWQESTVSCLCLALGRNALPPGPGAAAARGGTLRRRLADKDRAPEDWAGRMAWPGHRHAALLAYRATVRPLCHSVPLHARSRDARDDHRGDLEGDRVGGTSRHFGGHRNSPGRCASSLPRFLRRATPLGRVVRLAALATCATLIRPDRYLCHVHSRDGGAPRWWSGGAACVRAGCSRAASRCHVVPDGLPASAAVDGNTPKWSAARRSALRSGWSAAARGGAGPAETWVHAVARSGRFDFQQRGKAAIDGPSTRLANCNGTEWRWQHGDAAWTQYNTRCTVQHRGINRRKGVESRPEADRGLALAGRAASWRRDLDSGARRSSDQPSREGRTRTAAMQVPCSLCGRGGLGQDMTCPTL